ncbi:probable E3 ubiquitin-protein ligase DTX3 [Mizuhopecten yessoensis]|uniref:E3 ubiquitin-protein ligase n=1 Tax=Mizuhopecten yessoensis TaxID=6573 RepID=A0A210PX45_MIZYE|nr:probable E3 ubiquitin-protein ligase DTX3 [Mizuhopecten yessoensis]XP_021372971.1 probable E3 ubiquitin-protein ligase DTX3 [Mizuhopecten yessoensis]OWF41039.1 E3 ubiquitin-protein ligase DTX3 [Mizuhopecten yessoensis]
MAKVATMQQPNLISNLQNVTNPANYVGSHLQTLGTPPGEEPMETEEYPAIAPSQPGTMGTVIGTPQTEEENCSICLDSFTDKTVLPSCSHEFCKECIEQQFKYKPVCPICGAVYGKITGTQPPGHITITRLSNGKLPGYEQYSIISVSYSFPDGIQGAEHPHPGTRFSGTSRTGYFPDCPEGVKVVRLLKTAFDRRLVFTVGRSRTTGADNVVTWNDIHHKTTFTGGPQNFGYPDPTYLGRVTEELAAKGVTENDLDHTTLNIIH